jgi:hypothetical protein
MNHLALLSLCAIAPVAVAQGTIPNDFEPGSTLLSPVSSYFGGVGTFGARPSTTTIHSGRSLELWANFQHDTFFHIAGFQTGLVDLPRAALTFPANADTLSVTVRPPTAGRLQMSIAIREDDDGDGVYDSANDDSWESSFVLLDTTTNVYNIPVALLTLGNPGSGNGVLNLNTSPSMGIVVTFETRASLPGGIVEHPVSILVDHLGLYVGNQTIPPQACPADLDDGSGTGTHDNAVDINDLIYFIARFEAGSIAADLDNGSMTGTPDQAVTIDDLLFFLVRFEAGC